MGDTFSDAWEDEVPSEWGAWRSDGVYNSKWDGNFYTFSHKDNVRCKIEIHSRSPTEKWLSGKIYFEDDQTDPKDYSRYSLDLEAYIDARWTSVEEALTALDKAFTKFQSHVLALREVARAEEEKT